MVSLHSLLSLDSVFSKGRDLSWMTHNSAENSLVDSHSKIKPKIPSVIYRVLWDLASTSLTLTLVVYPLHSAAVTGTPKHTQFKAFALVVFIA